MKTAAIVQARLASTRLPGKVLFPLGNTTVLGQLVERLRLSRHLDGIIIAIPDEPRDEPLLRECERLDVNCFLGDEDDLTARFYEAAKKFEVENIVRITSDCPFFDPFLLDEMLGKYEAANAESTTFDYYTNCTLKRTYPRGIDAEVFTFAALEKSHREGTRIFEREHVTPYIYGNPEKFRLGSHENETDQSIHRWVLDTGRDWRFVFKVHEALAKAEELFTTEDILKLLQERPELTNLNAEVEQKHADNTFDGLLD